MSKNSHHVVPNDGRWSVRRAGAIRSTSTFDTQEEAIARAREIARKQRGEVYVHGTDGRIRERSTFGNDPFPPKG